MWEQSRRMLTCDEKTWFLKRLCQWLKMNKGSVVGGGDRDVMIQWLPFCSGDNTAFLLKVG